MPPQRTSQSSRDSSRHPRRSSQVADKFIPNLTQINEAAKELPDPEIWPDASYQYACEIDGKMRTMEFSRKIINRGKGRAARWVYEGKVLIRKRDV